MESYTLFHITIGQLVFCALTVIAIFLGKYNQLSDKMEATENHVYKVGLFFRYNWLNGLFYLLSGIVLLGIANELGLEFLIKNIADVDFSIGTEKVVDITIAVLSGAIGNKIIKKFV